MMEVVRSSQWKCSSDPVKCALSRSGALLCVYQAAGDTNDEHTPPHADSQRDPRRALGQGMRRLMDLVITPSSIPDFTIPRPYPRAESTKLQTRSSSESPSSFPDGWFYGAVGPRPRSEEHTLRHASIPKSSSTMAHKNDTWKQSNSEDVSPVHRSLSSAGMLRRSHTISYEMIEGNHHEVSSNADPRSLAAMSLPHLKTKTKFGFETLYECPKTTRKESLFHGAHSVRTADLALNPFMLKEQQSKRSCSNPALSAPVNTSFEHQRRLSSKRRHVASQVALLGVSTSLHNSMDSNVSSTGSSPVISRTHANNSSQSSTDEATPPPSLTEKWKRFRHRCPATFSQEDMGRQAAIVEPEAQAHSAGRWSNGCSPSLSEEDVQQLWRVSALTCTVGSLSSYPGSANALQSLLVIPRRHTKGQLKFALEYCHKKQQLGVHLMYGVELGGTSSAESTVSPVNAFVKLFLHPLSMGQRHTSAVVKATADPLFNQVFSFTDVTPEQLGTQKLCIRVLSREGMLRRQELLGELDVSLNELDFNATPRHELLRGLETEEIPRELGRLQASICFQADTETLAVTLLSVKDLPRKSITGSPDPYVLLHLRQSGRPEIRLTSKVKRKVTSTAINETFSFNISPRIEDLKYTCLSLIVYDREMIRSDQVLGEVRFGFGATEQSEFDHWNEVLSWPGREVTSWHMLMEEQ